MQINAMEWLGTGRNPLVDLDVVGSNPITRPSFFESYPSLENRERRLV